MRTRLCRWQESRTTRIDTRIGFTYGVLGYGRILTFCVFGWRWSLTWFVRDARNHAGHE